MAPLTAPGGVDACCTDRRRMPVVPRTSRCRPPSVRSPRASSATARCSPTARTRRSPSTSRAGSPTPTPSREEVSGYTLEEFRRMSFTDVITPEDLGPAVEAFDGAVHRSPQRLEANMRHKDGQPHRAERDRRARRGLRRGGRRPRPRRGRHRAERDAPRARAHPRAAEDANAAKSLFLANMSHEVRTPLTSVLGAAEILAEGDLGPGDRALVAIVQRSAEKLHRLVNDILDVSRLEAGKLDVQETVMSLQDVAADAITWAGPLAHKEGLTFTWALDPRLPHAGLRRRHAHLPGADQPARQRDEVHRAGRGAAACDGRRGAADRSVDVRFTSRTPASASRPSSWTRCSSPSPRPTTPPPASTAAPGSASRSARSWCT